MATITKVVCDKCNDETKEADNVHVYVLVMTNGSGTELPAAERDIEPTMMDMCGDCLAWYRQNICKGIVPIRFYNIGDNKARFEFGDGEYVEPSIGIQTAETDTDLNEPKEITAITSDKCISGKRATQVASQWKHTKVREGYNIRIRMMSVKGETIGWITTLNGGVSHLDLTLHIDGKRNRKPFYSTQFNGITVDADVMRFTFNGDPVYIIPISTRRGRA